MNGIDNVEPKENWEFDQEVTDAFDNMLERSIPEYDLMRKSVTDLANRYIKKGTTVMDIGCSKGEAVAPLIYEHSLSNTFALCDISEPMLDAVRKRFENYKESVFIQNINLKHDFPNVFLQKPPTASVILAILTIQFTPIEYRLGILKRIYDDLVDGGAFIFVEKVIGNTAGLDKDFKDEYYKMKKENGYTEDQITRKKLSLEGVLVPVTAKWNEEMLKTSGFTQIDCFWRWMNFAGWIAIK